MKNRWILLFILILAASATAQEHQHGDHPEQLGEVSFTVSCTPDAQKEFNRAIALLHDFWYTEAEKTFKNVAAIDPECVMAYWGISMSNYHSLWPPRAEETMRGKTAADKLKSSEAKTEREKSYITAISAFYRDTETLDHKTRAAAYAQEMGKVHNQNPDDLEAAVFYALALLATADASDKTYAVQKKAAAVLTPLVEKAPNHPGIAHYIIHSFDYPALASLALPAARTYAKIAPSSPHALHMPSHIFTRLGLWEEAIQSNIASAETAKKHVQKTMPDASSRDELHAMDYLVYAYLQLGQEDKAREIVQEAARIKKLESDNFAAAYAFAAIPARFTIERHQWKEAANLKVSPKWVPWDKFPYAEAITHYAVGVGSARSGNIDTAKKASDKLISIQKVLENQDPYWAKQVQIQQQTVAAWILFTEGKKADALKMMRNVAEMEDSTEKHPVTPGAIMPSHEMVAEMLLEMDAVPQAKTEFEKSRRTAPNRRHLSQHQ